MEDNSENNVDDLRDRAQALYDKNLALLIEKSRIGKSLWRVSMDENGIIVSMERCKPEKPRENTFSLLVPGDSKPPRFGNLNGLKGYQLSMIRQLDRDL